MSEGFAGWPGIPLSVQMTPPVAARPGRLALLRSPALRSGATFAAGGIGFALGNVLLARVLPEIEYGRVALFLALIQLGTVLGPVGVETLINRHRLHAGRALLARVGTTGMAAGLLLAAVTFAIYDLGAVLSALLALAIASAALNRVAAAFFQSQRKFGSSLFLILVHNWIVLLAVPVVLLTGRRDALPAALTIAAAYAATALRGWSRALRGPAEPERPAQQAAPSGEAPPQPALLHEGLMVLGMQLALAALYQLDRLIIPRALSIQDLATYSVVSAVAASPFRMLQTGLAFSLLPRLKACAGGAEVRRLIRHEIGIACGAALLACIGVLVFTDWVLRVALEGRYELPRGLLAAFVIVGLVRVWSGISSATATAFGTARHLAMLNAFSWLALLAAAASACAARGFGLTGIVYGVGVGWLGLAIAGSFIGARAVASRGAS